MIKSSNFARIAASAMSALGLLTVLAAVGCTSEKPIDPLRKIETGVPCVNNDPCPPSTACNTEIGYCEDIYFPKRVLRPY